MIYAFNKPGKLKLYGPMDYLIDFMELNSLLLGSFQDIDNNTLARSLGAFFIKNSIEIISYEDAQERQKGYEGYHITCDDSITEGKSGMFRPFIHNDKKYHLEKDFESETLITDFPGLLRYTNHFYHTNVTKLVKSKRGLKYPKICYTYNEEISIREIQEKIGWNLFCNVLNLDLDFRSLRTKSSLELLFLSISENFIAVKIENRAHSIDPFISTNIKLVDKKIVEVGFGEDCEFEYSPELFRLKSKVFPVVIYHAHSYLVLSSVAKNINTYLISSMSNIH
ncbi:hypothetical protein K502DRAFT_326358 [Neoconidiobolus thromboides FSU 785]|nr:hypothetical protein K502DRAFT_326358 [Neoconidiobolus thromboides FSU 785]